jgi:putative sporulation protein YtaF
MVLSLALSIDGLLVGFSYGARGIRVPGRSLAIIALCTGAGMGASMGLGQLAGGLIGNGLAHFVGGGALLLLGLWQLGQALVQHAAGKQADESQLLARWHLASFGIVIEIIHAPEAADQDASGDIDPKEAVALGVVLGLDTLAAGFAASLVGFGPLLVLLVTMGLFVLTWSGLELGKMFGQKTAQEHSPFIPAILLILIGLWEIW